MNDSLPSLIVMGVSGSGKSTIGRLLADRLERPFVDADDLHPIANKDKMAAGVPLDDADRRPWLWELASYIAAAEASGEPLVMACSALKRAYRSVLVARTPSTVFLHLVGGRDTIALRQARRDHEFMPASLLASQFAALEPLQADELGIVLDVAGEPADIVEDAVRRISGLVGRTP